MFSYIRLQNYKSFGDITLDLTNRQNNPKKVILIYGANGSGKSNISSAFTFLGESLRTMNVRDLMERLLEKKPEDVDDELFASIVKSRLRDLETLISEHKMISSTDSMILEFGFQLCGKNGRYIIETSSNEIIHERLEYVLTKNRGVMFDITSKKATISPKVFYDSSSYHEIKNACKKYWGKHSLLSIILYESQDKATSYIKEQIGTNLGLVLNFFSSVSCKVNFPSNKQGSGITTPNTMLRNYEKGSVFSKDEGTLDRNEKILNLFFKTLYPNICRVYYDRVLSDDTIRYNLYISKMIAGKIRDIPFELESTGTQSMLQLLPYMLLAADGSFVVIDEFDIGVHDRLTLSIFNSLVACTTGQVILTTHATSLMNEVPNQFSYIIREYEDGSKTVYPISYYETNPNKSTNTQKRYLQGEYGGISKKDISVNFTEMLHILEMTDAD